jgi:hypothetical protein
MAERHLILSRDETVQPPNKMDQEIVSEINKALFHQKSLAHIPIMNTRMNPSSANTAFAEGHVTVAMALMNRDVIITEAGAVNKGVIDVRENKSWESLTIHAVPLVRYKGNSTESLQKILDEIHSGNKGVAIHVQVRWPANPHIIRERRQKREISAFSMVFIVKGSKVAQELVKEGGKAVGVCYGVTPSTKVGPHCGCDHCCQRSHIESKCSGKRVCGYYPRPHRTRDDKCNVVGCTAMQGAVCGHTQEICPNCGGDYITFSSRWEKIVEVTRAAQEKMRGEPT